jgi:hypothetical protein
VTTKGMHGRATALRACGTTAAAVVTNKQYCVPAGVIALAWPLSLEDTLKMAYEKSIGSQATVWN